MSKIRRCHFFNLGYILLCIGFFSLACFLNADAASLQEIQTATTPTPPAIIEKQHNLELATEPALDTTTIKTAPPTRQVPQAKPQPKPTPSSTPSYASFIELFGRQIEIQNTDNTTDDAGSIVKRYVNARTQTRSGHFAYLFGHNSPAVFRDLPTLSIGSTFRARIDGQDRTYIVRRALTVEKAAIGTKSHDINGMYDLVNARYDGANYSLALMTCAGESRPGGDATHRFLLFADQV